MESKRSLQISEGNDTLKFYLEGKTYPYMYGDIPNWDFLMKVYDKVLKEVIYIEDDTEFDSIMIPVGDYLLNSDREGFFKSLVEVIKYLNEKSS